MSHYKHVADVSANSVRGPQRVLGDRAVFHILLTTHHSPLTAQLGDASDRLPRSFVPHDVEEVGKEPIQRLRRGTAVQRMAAVPPGECAISTITAYELYTGVEKCSKPAQERAKVDLLLQTVHEIAFESAAAKEAARIRALLESQGQPIGPYDLLLAGQALASSLVLVTANTSEFNRVPGLTSEDRQT